MTPGRITDDLIRDAQCLHVEDSLEQAIRVLLDSDLPALPVIDDDNRLRGIFGEREFITALFPGYVGALGYAGFVRGTLDHVIQTRAGCRTEHVGRHMNAEHIDVDYDHSDLGIAEIFLHHRVLIIPVTGPDGVRGVITRTDFFTRLAERFLHADP